jgi:hypothetical protein
MLGLALLAAVPASAAEDLSGRDVMRRMEATRARGDGATSQYAFRLIAADGSAVTRTLTTQRKRCGASTRLLVVVRTPPDVAGLTVLTWSYPDRAPDMWMYAPELGRVRQLNAAAQSDSFMGSDVTYGDLAPLPIDFRRHRLLGMEDTDGEATYVVESTPTLPERYTRIVTWVSARTFLPVRTAYYDRASALLRRGRIGDARLVQGIPTPFRIDVEDVQRRHRTEVTLVRVEHDTPVACNRLTTRYLRRGP